RLIPFPRTSQPFSREGEAPAELPTKPARKDTSRSRAVYHMPIKFAILGDGAWGTAIGILLAAHPDHRVALWSARDENARILRDRRENVVYLPGVPITDAIELTTDIGQALTGADLLIVAIPTVY